MEFRLVKIQSEKCYYNLFVFRLTRFRKDISVCTRLLSTNTGTDLSPICKYLQYTHIQPPASLQSTIYKKLFEDIYRII